MTISIIASVLIGAAIGGFTNLIAIRMLFRPYKQWHIGSWNVPLTPGLIPKRHEELASQLGTLVTSHLLTSEGIKRAIEDRLKERIFQLVNEKLTGMISSERTLKDYVQSWLLTEDYDRFIAQLDDKTTNHLLEMIIRKLRDEKLRSQAWGDLATRYIPEAWESKIKETVAQALQRGLIRFVENGGLQQPLQHFVSQLTGGSQGMFGKLASMFIDDSKIAGMVEPKILEYLSTEQLKNRLFDYLDAEWQVMKQQQIGSTLDQYIVIDHMEKALHKASESINLSEKLFNLPLSQLVIPLSTVIAPFTNDMMERLWHTFIEKLEKGIVVMELDKVVKDEVLSFPLPKLEQIIVDIAGKELQLITLLGALLGGVIGLLQGALYFLLNQ